MFLAMSNHLSDSPHFTFLKLFRKAGKLKLDDVYSIPSLRGEVYLLTINLLTALSSPSRVSSNIGKSLWIIITVGWCQ